MSVPLRHSLAAALLFVVTSSTPAAEPKRKIACKTPQNMSSCSWIHGRLRTGNGTPAFRLWRIPTNHLYGIYSGPYGLANDSKLLDNENPELPANVLAAFESDDKIVFAEFEICPLEPLHKGAMQAACIQAARHIVVK